MLFKRPLGQINLFTLFTHALYALEHIGAIISGGKGTKKISHMQAYARKSAKKVNFVTKTCIFGEKVVSLRRKLKIIVPARDKNY